MKFSKKTLIALAIAGAIGIGGGIGTYAYFSSEVTSTGNKINAGTLYFEGDENHKGIDLGSFILDQDHAYPTTFWGHGHENYEQFTIKNGGNLPMNLQSQVHLTLNDQEVNSSNELASKFRVVVEVGRIDNKKLLASNDTEQLDPKPDLYDTTFYEDRGDFVTFACPITELKENLDEAMKDFKSDGEEDGILASKEEFMVRVWYWLGYDADNRLQGAELSADLTIRAKQINASWEDTYSQKPSKVTEENKDKEKIENKDEEKIENKDEEKIENKDKEKTEKPNTEEVEKKSVDEQKE